MPADYFGSDQGRRILPYEGPLQPTIQSGRKGGVPITQGGIWGNLFGFVSGVTDVIANTAEDAARVARATVDFDNPFVYDQERGAGGVEYELGANERLAAGREPDVFTQATIVPGVPNLVLGVGALAVGLILLNR